MLPFLCIFFKPFGWLVVPILSDSSFTSAAIMKTIQGNENPSSRMCEASVIAKLLLWHEWRCTKKQ